MEIGSFSAFLSERIKVGGKAGALGEAVSVASDKTKVAVTKRSRDEQALHEVPHQEVPQEAQRSRLVARDRVQQMDRNVYELRYFNIAWTTRRRNKYRDE